MSYVDYSCESFCNVQTGRIYSDLIILQLWKSISYRVSIFWFIFNLIWVIPNKNICVYHFGSSMIDHATWLIMYVSKMIHKQKIILWQWLKK